MSHTDDGPAKLLTPGEEHDAPLKQEEETAEKSLLFAVCGVYVQVNVLITGFATPSYTNTAIGTQRMHGKYLWLLPLC